jgi:hypothetical protein
MLYAFVSGLTAPTKTPEAVSPVIETVYSPEYVNPNPSILVKTDERIEQFQPHHLIQTLEQKFIYVVLGLQLLFIYVWILWTAKYQKIWD